MSDTPASSPGDRPQQGNAILDEEFDNLLARCWEQLALFAFESFKNNGRGVVFLDRQDQTDNILDAKIDLGYAVFEQGRPDADVAGMIENYDPNWEIIFQYLRPEMTIRTVRVRTAPSNRHPWRVYLFERLLQDDD